MNVRARLAEQPSRSMIATHFPVALAFAIFTTCLAWLAMPAAQDSANSSTTSVSWSIPAATASREDDIADFPTKILSDEDAAIYKTVFELQRKGDWKGAAKELREADDRLLAGHVMAERLLDTAYAASPQEVSRWMRNYADLPQRETLAQRFQRQDEKHDPQAGPLTTGATLPTTTAFEWKGRVEAKAVWDLLDNKLKSGAAAEAGQLLNTRDAKTLLAPTEYQTAATNVVNALFMAGDDDAALSLMQKQARVLDGAGNFTIGLASWRSGRMEPAAKQFATLAASRSMPESERAASAFWAYRSYHAMRRQQEALKHLRLAASFDHTFYGIVAGRVLEKMQEQHAGGLTYADLANMPSLRRAIALMQVDEEDLAAAELQALYAESPSFVRPKLEELAEVLNIGDELADVKNKSQDDTLKMVVKASSYPIPQWQPKGGFSVDPALMFALIKKESGFEPSAKSPVGAVGIMQLMPETARYMRESGGSNDQIEKVLLQPELNMALGQKYLSYLLKKPEVEGNLFYLAAAYNAGPGKMARWRKEVRYKNDPFLFIESIPSRETRQFVEEVVASYWIYRSVMGMDNPSLEQLAGGDWPHYTFDPASVAKLRIIEESAGIQ